MKLDLDKSEEWDIAQEITVQFLKYLLDTTLEFDKNEDTIRAYLYVIAENMWIGDFKKYAEEKGVTHYCQEIYKQYEI